MRVRLSALALSAALALGGCQNPDGSVDWGNTLLLGAGVGAAAALVAGAASDSGWRRHDGRARGYHPGHGHYRPVYRHGPPHGYGYRPAPRYGYGYGYGYGYAPYRRGW